MSYTAPKMCPGCGNPESLCEDSLVCAFMYAHVIRHDGHVATIGLDTLRVIVHRAQEWGRIKTDEHLKERDAASSVNKEK